MNIENSLISPFNIKESLHVDFFSLDDTKSLIKDYCLTAGVAVSQEVVSLLYEYTSGYLIYFFTQLSELCLDIQVFGAWALGQYKTLFLNIGSLNLTESIGMSYVLVVVFLTRFARIPLVVGLSMSSNKIDLL